MKRYLLIAVLIELTGCHAPSPVPTLCTLPRHLAGWNGVTVRLSGAVIGTPEHGYMLLGIGCRKSITLTYPDDDLIRRADEAQAAGHLPPMSRG